VTQTSVLSMPVLSAGALVTQTMPVLCDPDVGAVDAGALVTSVLSQTSVLSMPVLW
jgi:hypothetical protein